MKTVIFCSFPDFAGNARSLYNYMSKKYKNKMKFIWVVKDNNMYNNLKQKGISVVKEGTKQMQKVIDRADAVFSTHANLIDYKEQNSDLLYIELWHGIGPKNSGYLLRNISESDVNWMKKFDKKVDYIIVPTDFWRIIFSSLFNINPNRVLDLGLPLVDSILKSNGKGNLAKVLDCDISKYNKIIYYMPTVRSGTSRDENISINTHNIFNIKDYDEDVMLEFLKRNNYLLCVKYHPSEKIEFTKVESDYVKYIYEEEMKKYELDTSMLLNASDLLISDYSSLGIHYLSLERPVIYLENDLEEYSIGRGIIFDNQEFWTDNNTAIDIDGLMTTIKNNLNNPDVEGLKKKKEFFFGNTKDGGCKKICEGIFDSDGNLKIKSIINEKEEESNVNENYFLELASIKNSRSYKLTQKIKKILRINNKN